MCPAAVELPGRVGLTDTPSSVSQKRQSASGARRRLVTPASDEVCPGRLNPAVTLSVGRRLSRSTLNRSRKPGRLFKLHRHWAVGRVRMPCLATCSRLRTTGMGAARHEHLTTARSISRRPGRANSRVPTGRRWQRGEMAASTSWGAVGGDADLWITTAVGAPDNRISDPITLDEQTKYNSWWWITRLVRR